MGALASMKVFHHKTNKAEEFKDRSSSGTDYSTNYLFSVFRKWGDYSALIAILINNAY